RYAFQLERLPATGQLVFPTTRHHHKRRGETGDMSRPFRSSDRGYQPLQGQGGLFDRRGSPAEADPRMSSSRAGPPPPAFRSPRQEPPRQVGGIFRVTKVSTPKRKSTDTAGPKP